MSSHEAAECAEAERWPEVTVRVQALDQLTIRDTLTQRGHKYQGLHISHCCREWDCHRAARSPSTDGARIQHDRTALREKARPSANGARTIPRSQRERDLLLSFASLLA